MEDIIRQVYTELGPGYSESVYHAALEVALRQNGIQYETERIIPVYFRGHVVGNLRADIVIQDPQMVLELKSVRNLTEANRTQIRSYLKLLQVHHGLLINFGDELCMERFYEKPVQAPSAAQDTTPGHEILPQWLQ